MPDLVTLLEFESGQLSEKQIVEMIAEMIKEQGYDGLTGKFHKIARDYIHKDIMDDEGNVNYIKLKEED